MADLTPEQINEETQTLQENVNATRSALDAPKTNFQIPDVIPQEDFNTMMNRTQLSNKRNSVDNMATSFQNTQNQLLQNVTQFLAPTAQEQALTQQIGDIETSTQKRALALEDRPILTDVAVGQAQTELRLGAIERNSLVNQLNSATADRQTKLQAAQLLYDANRNNLQDTLALYKATAPESLSTTVDEVTGEIKVTTRNPVTGELSTQVAGKVTPTQATTLNDYVKTDFITDSATGQVTFVGVRQDGTLEKINTGLEDIEPSTVETEFNELLSVTEATNLGVPYGTTKGEAINMGVIPSEQLTGEDKIKLEIDLANDFEKYAGESRSAQRQIGIMKKGYESAVQAGLDGTSNNAPSQAVLVTFQKLLDPTSVVRESEYARSGDGQSLVARMQGTIEKLKQGGAGVTEKELKNFYDLSLNLLGGYENEQLNFARRTQTQADNYGLNIENILTPDVLGLLEEMKPKPLKQFNESINSLDDLIKYDGGYEDMMRDIWIEDPNLTEDEVLQEIRNIQGFNQDLNTSVNGSLGSLSSKFESGGNPGAIGYDTTGGNSYGVFQITQGNIPSYLSNSKFADELEGLDPTTSAFKNKWKEIAERDPAGFEADQREYIKRTHFDPQLNKINKAGFDINKYSDVLKDVIWSTAVQHGPQNTVIINAFEKVGDNPTEEELIKAIYDERWSGGQRFGSSTEGVKNAVFNRFFGQNGELNQALNKIG